MLARAFACYITDLTGGKSEYLSGHSDTSVTIDFNERTGEADVLRAFPVDEERAAINKAFDALFAELKRRELLQHREGFDAGKVIARYSVEYETDETRPAPEYPSNPDAYFTDPSIYTYEFLTRQPDMKVIRLPALSEVQKNGEIDRDLVRDLGMESARRVGEEYDGKVYVTNKYSGQVINLTRKSTTHSVGGNEIRIENNARISAVAGEIIQNAIPVNGLTNAGKNVNGTYAMAAYLTDGKDYIAIVTVEQKTGDVKNIGYDDVVHAISGECEKAACSSQKRDLSYGTDTALNAAASTISIANLLEVVKQTHQSILSEDVSVTSEKPAPGRALRRAGAVLT
jgi:hypothetical protein